MSSQCCAATMRECGGWRGHGRSAAGYRVKRPNKVLGSVCKYTMLLPCGGRSVQLSAMQFCSGSTGRGGSPSRLSRMARIWDVDTGKFAVLHGHDAGVRGWRGHRTVGGWYLEASGADATGYPQPW